MPGWVWSIGWSSLPIVITPSSLQEPAVQATPSLAAIPSAASAFMLRSNRLKMIPPCTFGSELMKQSCVVPVPVCENWASPLQIMRKTFHTMWSWSCPVGPSHLPLPL